MTQDSIKQRVLKRWLDEEKKALTKTNNPLPLIITNGMARSGKDTFSTLLNNYTSVFKYSSIDKVKAIARQCGWNGEKTEKARAFLSELKMLTSKYYDMSFNDIKQKYEDFQKNEFYEVMVVDIREPKEIAKAKEQLGAITVFIENNRVPQLTSNYGDAHVRDYEYDYIIENNGSIEEFEEKTKEFFENVLKPLMCPLNQQSK